MSDVPIADAASHILLYIAIITTGGILGGIAQSLNSLSLWKEKRQGDGYTDYDITVLGIAGEDNIPLYNKHILLIIVSGIIIGSAGAFGVVGVLCLTPIFKEGVFNATATTLDVLEVFGISVVAGFVARQLLPVLGENISDKIKTDVEKTKVGVDNLNKAMETELERNRNNEKTIMQLNKDIQDEKNRSILRDARLMLAEARNADYVGTIIDDEVWREVAGFVKSILDKNIKDRHATIVYARFFTEKPANSTRALDYIAGIDILTKFITQDDVSRKDKGDVFYNRSIYNLKIYAARGGINVDVDNIESYLKRALDDLEQACTLNPDNKASARADEDFRLLWDNPEFIRLTEE